MTDEELDYEAEHYLAATKSYGGCFFERYQGIDMTGITTFADWLARRKKLTWRWSGTSAAVNYLMRKGKWKGK